MAKTHGSRFSWKSLPEEFGAVLKALIKRGGSFKYPADVGTFIRGSVRFYSGEKGKADEIQRFCQNIGVIVRHILPEGRRRTIYYVDADRAQACLRYMENPRQYKFPGNLTDSQTTRRAAHLHRVAQDVGSRTSKGPEMAPMDPKMARRRDRDLERSGAFAAAASPTGDDSGDDSATVADTPVLRDDVDDVDAAPISSTPSSGHHDKPSPTRVLFMTLPEWWVWEHLSARFRTLKDEYRVGVGEDDSVFALDMDLSGEDSDRPSVDACTTAVERMVEHGLLRRLGDSGGGHGAYAFVVEPHDFFVEIVEGRPSVSMPRVYVNIMDAMMAGHGPDHKVAANWNTRLLPAWLDSQGWIVTSETVRIKMCGSSANRFKRTYSQVAWCVWYNRQTVRQAATSHCSQWLLAWRGFLPIEPCAVDVEPKLLRRTGTDDADAMAEVADIAAAPATVDDAVAIEPVAEAPAEPVAAVASVDAMEPMASAVADASDNGAPVVATAQVQTPLERLAAQIVEAEAELASTKAVAGSRTAKQLDAEITVMQGHREGLERELRTMQDRLVQAQESCELAAKRKRDFDTHAPRIHELEAQLGRLRSLRSLLQNADMAALVGALYAPLPVAPTSS